MALFGRFNSWTDGGFGGPGVKQHTRAASQVEYTPHLRTVEHGRDKAGVSWNIGSHVYNDIKSPHHGLSLDIPSSPSSSNMIRLDTNLPHRLGCSLTHILTKYIGLGKKQT